MQRYKIASKDGKGNIQTVTAQEAFPSGPPVGASIPCDLSNMDYQAYLAWVAEGNEPDPKDE